MNQKQVVSIAALLVAIPVLGFSGELEKIHVQASLDSVVGRAVSQAGLQGEQISRERGDRPTLPPPPMAKDAFAGVEACRRIDRIQFVMRPSLSDAVRLLEPCMQAVSQRYGVTVLARGVAIVGPEGAPGGVPGIGIDVVGLVPIGNTILLDLNFTLAQRNHYILTYPARLLLSRIF